MAKVVTLGEIMLRLSSPGQKRFVQSDTFDVVYGGGEANVAVSLANYGHDAYFVTKLPKHEIGQCALNAVRRYGVNTQFIARGGERLGIYYLESGASMRPSKVVYDRAHSSISEADPSDFDFEAHKELVPMQPGDVPVTYSDTSALEREFGFRPSTPLRVGLRRFAQWYKAFYL